MNLAILISGGGTTAEAILKACKKDGPLYGLITPVLLISSKQNVKGLERARQSGMLGDKDILVIEKSAFASREAFGEAIIKECKARSVDLISQNGWMEWTPKNVIEAFPNRMINQHPGPLDPGHPDFGGDGMCGLRVHATRLAFVRAVGRDFWTEATAQRVDPAFDAGAILKCKRVEIMPEDTPESLQSRVLPFEYEVVIEILKDFSQGQVQEFKRTERLVSEGEEEILKTAKEKARKQYLSI